jgi:crossover junction endonuclease MUS81
MSTAMIRLDHDDFINLRKIEFLADQRTHPFASQLRLVDTQTENREGVSSLYGYVVEEGAPPTCSKFTITGQTTTETQSSTTGPLSTKASPERSLKRPLEVMLPSSDGFDGIEDIPTPAKKIGTKSKSTFARTASAPSAPTSTSKLAAEAALRRVKGNDPLSRTQSSADLPVKVRTGPRLSSHIPAATPLMEIDEHPIDESAIPDFRPDQATIFPAGSYEVVMVLDTREIESKSSRDNFSEAIRSKGINVETRALRLGDVLWIARRRDGLGGEEDECVLDYVVERKRLDDLCHSIKDGRYTEQCVCSFSLLSWRRSDDSSD